MLKEEEELTSFRRQNTTFHWPDLQRPVPSGWACTLELIFVVGYQGFSVAQLFLLNAAFGIAGFHCHTIMKTIQQIKSKIKEIKEDEYSNSLPKVQVCAIFGARDIRRIVYSNL